MPIKTELNVKKRGVRFLGLRDIVRIKKESWVIVGGNHFANLVSLSTFHVWSSSNMDANSKKIPAREFESWAGESVEKIGKLTGLKIDMIK